MVYLTVDQFVSIDTNAFDFYPLGPNFDRTKIVC